MANQNDDTTADKSIDRDNVDNNARQLTKARRQRVSLHFSNVEVRENRRLRENFAGIEAVVDKHGRFRIEDTSVDGDVPYIWTRDTVELGAWR